MSKCIEHNQKGTKEGYGHTYSKEHNKVVRMHRLAYCFAKGIPLEHIRGLVVRHSCDNPRCINPQHLLIGTHKDNMDDMYARGRQPNHKGSLNGSAVLTEATVLIIRQKYSTAVKRSYAVLAAEFGVTRATIAKIIKRKTWSHI